MKTKSSPFNFTKIIFILLITLNIYGQELIEKEIILPNTSEFQKIPLQLIGETYFFDDVAIDIIEKPVYYDDIFSDSDNVKNLAVAIKNKDYLWTNSTIPYVISSRFSESRKKEIKEAIAHINEKTNLHIKPRTNEYNYIYIQNDLDDDRCWSKVGMIGRMQRIEISEWCGVGNIVHEFMHAAGFYHEHSRPDRDNYIRIKSSHLTNSNYRKLRYTNSVKFGKYDFGSIMHYPKGIFTCKKPCPNVGQRIALSSLDIEGVNSLYPSVSIYKNSVPKATKKKLVPVYVGTTLADDQIYENVFFEIGDKEENVSASYKKKKAYKTLYLEEGKKYEYTLFVTCWEAQEDQNGHWSPNQRTGTGKDSFVVKKGMLLDLASNRRSTSSKNYNVVFNQS